MTTRLARAGDDSPARDGSGGVRRSAARRDVSAWTRTYLIVALIPALYALFSALSPSRFFTLTNFQTLLSTNAVNLTLACGLTLVLASGEFDLSFGGTVGLVPAVVVSLRGAVALPDAIIIIIGLAVAGLVGVINAAVVVRLGVDSFIVTLGMGTLAEGVGLALTSSQTVPGNVPLVNSIFITTVGGVELIVYYGFACALVLWAVFEHTVAGRHLYFVGAGRPAARLSGIRVDRIRGISLIGSSLFAGIGGLVMLGQTGAADATYGEAFLLPVFAAVFLGYSTIRVGRVNPLGSLAGIFLIGVGTTGLELLSVPSWVTQVFSGGILVVAVAAAKIMGRSAAASVEGAV